MKLPDPLEKEVLKIFEGQDLEGEPAIEALCRSHPEHAGAIRAMAAAAFEDHAWTTLTRLLASSAGPTPADESPERFGSYRVHGVLGCGGMGKVYRARHDTLGRWVALKVVRRDHRDGAKARARFVREVQAASSLDHPHICHVFELGEHEGEPFMAMQLIHGCTLQAAIARARSGAGDAPHSPLLERMPATRREVNAVLHYVEKVARALHVAHEAGLIHRDVKPGNLMVTDEGEPSILDFGLAEDRASAAGTASPDGTPRYLAPEQLQPGRTLDHRVDVHALGATLYEALTLQPPFSATSEAELHQQIASAMPAKVRSLNPALPTDLDAVLARALAKEPQRRYPTALALAEDLRRVRCLEPILAQRSGAVQRLVKWTSRNPIAAALIASLLITVTLAASTLRAWASERVVQGDLLLQTAGTAFRLGQWKTARQSFEGARQLGCSDPIAAEIGIAECDIELIDEDAARERLEALDRSVAAPHAARIAVLLGSLLLKTGTMEEGVAMLREAQQELCQAKTASADLHYCNAMLSEDLRQVETELRTALDLDPLHRAAARAALVVLLVNGKPQEADRLADRLQVVYRDDPHLHIARVVAALVQESAPPKSTHAGLRDLNRVADELAAILQIVRKQWEQVIVPLVDPGAATTPDSAQLLSELAPHMMRVFLEIALGSRNGGLDLATIPAVRRAWEPMLTPGLTLRRQTTRRAGIVPAFLALAQSYPDPLVLTAMAASLRNLGQATANTWREVADWAGRAVTATGMTGHMPTVRRLAAATYVVALRNLRELLPVDSADRNEVGHRLSEALRTVTALPGLTRREFDAYAAWAEDPELKDLIHARRLVCDPK